MNKARLRREYLEHRIVNFGAIGSGEIREYIYEFPNENQIFECILEFIFENTGLVALIPQGNGVLFSEHSKSLKFGQNKPSIAVVGRTLANVQEDQKLSDQSAFAIRISKGLIGFSVRNEFTTPILNSGFLIKQVFTKVEEA